MKVVIILQGSITKIIKETQIFVKSGTRPYTQEFLVFFTLKVRLVAQEKDLIG